MFSNESGFKLIDERIEIELHKKMDLVEKGEIIATVQGPIASLLTAERVILNVIQRMSGIATMTRKAVLALDSSHTRICDTRKRCQDYVCLISMQSCAAVDLIIASVYMMVS